MSLFVYLSHTGQRYTVSTSEIPTPESLKQWIVDHIQVPVARQIFMTATGKNVKQQHLVQNSQIYLYDKQFLASSEPPTIADEEEILEKDLREPPSELENETSLAAWQQLFKQRRAWALDAVDRVKSLSQHSSAISERCENIDRSTNVALDNLKNHVSSLQTLFEKTAAWAQDTLQEHADMLREWRSMTETLKELPVRDDVGRLMQTAAMQNGNTDAHGTMFTLLLQQELESAHTILNTSSTAFKTQVTSLSTDMDQLKKESNTASALTQIDWPNLETESLLQEAETLAKKVDGDYNDVLRAGPDTKVISRISRVAATHTNELLPGMQEIIQESSQAYEAAREHKKTLSGICFKVLKSISHIQGTLAGLQGQISNLTLSNEGQQSLETLDRVFRLPSAYGNVLIEAVRRTEWNDKTIAELKTLKDELGQLKDDEVRRRKKWTNNMSAFLNEETSAASVGPHNIPEASFSTPNNPWPFVTREEISSYIDDLRALRIDDAVEQVTQQLVDLDASAKSKRQRPKPFKNGSIHDALSSSFVQNTSGDNTKTLQEDKSRLEDKLRASESRIRKLEDLLHRQSQQAQSQAASINRAPSGVFTPISANDFERQPPSPGPEPSVGTRANTFDPASLSRRSSVSHQPHVRRLSNQTSDTKELVQRIVGLESQLASMKQDQEANVKALQETESVKRDLLANFDAQRAEFDDERQRLEDESHELKIKLEELEEELDRVVGSRDHERMKGENMLGHLRTELERVRKTGVEEITRLREQRETLESDAKAARDKHAHTEAQLQQLRADRSSLQSKNLENANNLRRLQNLHSEIVGTLQSVHEQLSPAGSAPDDLKRLASALEVLAEGATIHARGLDDTLQLANAQGKANEEKIEHLEAQLNRVHVMKTEVESKVQDKEEQLRQARHTVESLKAELTDERKQAERLRAQFTAGETGSDALKSRLANEEKKVLDLTEAKDKSEVQVEILQQNLNTLREDMVNLNKAAEKAQASLKSREDKAKSLSERLFQHNDRIIRLVESFGYLVSREDDSLSIQRASRANASQLLGDAVGTPMKRQISGTIPAQHYSDPEDAQTIYWTHDDPSLENDRFEAFLKTLARFDTDTTIEIITKRYKDVEGLAKKYQKDSRLHREKTHRLQSEAHEKIAYRSFKEGDLALFLPTRNQATKPWAAFNVGAPHYFLRENDGHRLQTRDWLLARISKIEERIVDLSRSMGNASTKANADGGASDGASIQSIDDNPFELSDGLRWYLIEANEEKPGAPSTPGLGKSTVAASSIAAQAQMGRKSSGIESKDKGSPSAVNAAKTLHKSLDSRRSSEASRKSTVAPPLLRTTASNSSAVAPLTTTGTDGEAEGSMTATAGPSVRPSEADQRQSKAREDDKIFDVAQSQAQAFPRPDLRVDSNSTHSSPVKSVKGQGRTESPSKKQKEEVKGWERLFSFSYQA